MTDTVRCGFDKVGLCSSDRVRHIDPCVGLTVNNAAVRRLPGGQRGVSRAGSGPVECPEPSSRWKILLRPDSSTTALPERD
ncbi:unnamed protein product [Gadus morhua 'NCC']